MFPVIYQPCDESSVIDAENPLFACWSDRPPVVGELVSMGQEKRWKVIEVSAFKPVDLAQQIESIYLVEVHPDELSIPPQNQWSRNTFKEDHPDECINLMVNDTIEIGFNMRGFPPKIGSHLQSYEQIGNTTAMRSTDRPWVVDRVSLYLPADTTAPYSKVHLCHCKELALVA